MQLTHLEIESNILVYESVTSNNPFDAALTHDLEITFESMPETFVAMYARIGDKGFAILSDSIEYAHEKFYLAVCLYYHLKKRPKIMLQSGPVDEDFSALYFAYDLLSYGVEREHGETVSEYDKRIGVPEAMSRLKMERLN